MSLEAFGDENPYTNGPMKECPDCEGYGKAGHFECGTCSGTGEVYEEYEPCEGDVL
jgi:DnaJ-class molecular chaperone